MVRLLFGNAFSMAVWGFLAVSILSVLASKTPGNCVKPILIRISLFIFCILLIYVIRDRRGIKLCMLGLVIACIFTVSAGVYEMITENPVIKEVRFSDTAVRTGLETENTGTMRVQGLAANPNNFAGELTILLTILLCLLSTTVLWRWRISGGILAFLIITLIIATASRAAWLGFILVVGIYMLAAPLPRKRLVLTTVIVGLTVAILMIILLFPNIAALDRARNVTGSSVYGITFRAKMLQASLLMGWQNPWLGVGTGNFAHKYHQVAGQVPFLVKKIAPYSHNEFAAIFAENGIFGLIAYCLIHFAVLWNILFCFCSALDTEAKILAAGLLSSFVGFVFCINFYHMWGNKYGWTVIGLSVAFTKVLRAERERQKKTKLSALKINQSNNAISTISAQSA